MLRLLIETHWLKLIFDNLILQHIFRSDTRVIKGNRVTHLSMLMILIDTVDTIPVIERAIVKTLSFCLVTPITTITKFLSLLFSIFLQKQVFLYWHILILNPSYCLLNISTPTVIVTSVWKLLFLTRTRECISFWLEIFFVVRQWSILGFNLCLLDLLQKFHLSFLLSRILQGTFIL